MCTLEASHYVVYIFIHIWVFDPARRIVSTELHHPKALKKRTADLLCK